MKIRRIFFISPFQSQKWSFLSTVNRYLHEFKTDFSEAKVSKRARHTFRLVSYFLYNMTHTDGGFFFKMYLPAIGFLQRGKILDVIDGCVPKEGKILLFEATLFDYLSEKKESKYSSFWTKGRKDQWSSWGSHARSEACISITSTKSDQETLKSTRFRRLIFFF